jgi:hypothetical protein
MEAKTKGIQPLWELEIVFFGNSRASLSKTVMKSIKMAQNNVVETCVVRTTRGAERLGLRAESKVLPPGAGQESEDVTKCHTFDENFADSSPRDHGPGERLDRHVSEASSDPKCETVVTRRPWRCRSGNRFRTKNSQSRGCQEWFVYTSGQTLEKHLGSCHFVPLLGTSGAPFGWGRSIRKSFQLQEIGVEVCLPRRSKNRVA